MSVPASSGRPPSRRPAPSAVPLGGARAEAPRSETGAAAPSGYTVSHTTGAIRLRSSRTGAPRTGSVRSRGRTGQVRSLRSTPSRPELRLLQTTGPVSGARGQSARPSRRAPFVLLVVGMLVGTTIGLLVLNTAVAVDSLKATSMRTANTQRSQEVQRLEQQVVDADTPQHLVDEATKAGLVPAGTPGHLVIQPDGTTVLRGTPSPAPPSTPGTSPAAGSPTPPAPTSPASPTGADTNSAGD